MPTLECKINVGRIDCFFKIIIWLTIIIKVVFVVELILKALVDISRMTKKEDLRSLTHIIFTLTRKLVWPT